MVIRRYLDGDRIRQEEVVWQHVPNAASWRVVKRLWGTRRVRVEGGPIDGRGRPLPEWADPGLVPNRWLWVTALHEAADLETVEPDHVDPRIFHDDSPYWEYYALPLRAGVKLLS